MASTSLMVNLIICSLFQLYIFSYPQVKSDSISNNYLKMWMFIKQYWNSSDKKDINLFRLHWNHFKTAFGVWVQFFLLSDLMAVVFSFILGSLMSHQEKMQFTEFLNYLFSVEQKHVINNKSLLLLSVFFISNKSYLEGMFDFPHLAWAVH